MADLSHLSTDELLAELQSGAPTPPPTPVGERIKVAVAQPEEPSSYRAMIAPIAGSLAGGAAGAPFGLAVPGAYAGGALASYLAGDTSGAQRQVLPGILGAAAAALPGGPVMQAVAQGGANLLGVLGNEQMGLEQPSATNRKLAALLPIATQAGGSILNELVGATGRGAENLIRAPAALSEKEIATLKADLGEQWTASRTAAETTMAEQRAAQLAQWQAQVRAQDAAYNAQKVMQGEQNLAAARQQVQSLQPAVPSKQLYAPINALAQAEEQPMIPLTNYRAQTQAFGEPEELQKRLFGVSSSPIVSRLAGVQPEGEQAMEELTAAIQGAARGNYNSIKPELIDQFNAYQRSGGALNFADFLNTKLGQHLATQGMSGDLAPVSAVAYQIQNMNQLIRKARSAGDGNTEGALRQIQAGLYADLDKAPGQIAEQFNQAQKAFRREQANSDLLDMIGNSIQTPNLPGQPVTTTLNAGSLVRKVLTAQRQDPLFAGSYQPGELEKTINNFSKLAALMPGKPLDIPKPVAPSANYEAPSLLLPPEPAEKSHGVLKFFSSISGALAGEQLGVMMGHPMVGFMTGGTVGRTALYPMLLNIAHSDTATELLTTLAKAGQNRVSMEALQALAVMAEQERAVHRTPRPEISLVPQAGQRAEEGVSLPLP